MDDGQDSGRKERVTEEEESHSPSGSAAAAPKLLTLRAIKLR